MKHKIIMAALLLFASKYSFCQYLGGDGAGEKKFAVANINLLAVAAYNDGLYKGGSSKGENAKEVKIIRLSRCNDLQLVWNGNQSVFWGNAANWDCGEIPFDKSRITIPADITRMPVIISNATASRIIFLANTTLNVIGNSAKLILTGK
jgi:hypothetical protein